MSITTLPAPPPITLTTPSIPKNDKNAKEQQKLTPKPAIAQGWGLRNPPVGVCLRKSFGRAVGLGGVVSRSGPLGPLGQSKKRLADDCNLSKNFDFP